MTLQQSTLIIAAWLISFPLVLAILFEAGAAWAKAEALQEAERRREP